MKYISPIQKNLQFFHKFGNVIFGTTGKIIGNGRAKVLKQKIKLAFEEKPELTVSSQTERGLFERLKNEMHVVFDIGIQNELSYFKIHPDCDYHLFEPNKKFTALIKKQMADFDHHRIKLNEYGLSDKSEEGKTYYEESQSFMANPHLGYDDVDTGKRYSLRTIDDYVKENHINHIDFLKVDTEGFDYKILCGGMETIRSGKISYIQFEYWQGLQRFRDLLKDYFDLYIVMEPRLLTFMREKVIPSMTPEQKQVNYAKSLIPVNQATINLIDTKIAPLGAGCNIFGISKTKKGAEQRLIFDIKA